MNKRGQATPFIILGIIIVVIAIIVISVYKPELISRRLNEAQLEPIKNYVENCVKDVLEQDLFILKENAGNYGRGRLNTFYNLNYLIYNDENYYHANGNIAAEINRNIGKKLLECNLDSFKTDYDIIEKNGEIKVDTQVGDHFISSNVYYPIIISKGDISIELNSFSVGLETDFGLMNNIANLIINEELYGDGYSNKDLEDGIYDEEYIEVNYEYISNADGTRFSIGTLKERDNRYSFLIKK